MCHCNVCSAKDILFEFYITEQLENNNFIGILLTEKGKIFSLKFL